ncbi:MAG: glycosyltransferase family 1 protein [Anaerolineae bacterium]|nr:glycosyltransferase family 1 protein [Anaerolineae bacterium]
MPNWDVVYYLDTDIQYSSYWIYGLEQLARQGVIRLSKELTWSFDFPRPFKVHVLVLRIRKHNIPSDNWTYIALDSWDHGSRFLRELLPHVEVYYKSNYNQHEIDQLAEHEKSKIKMAGLYYPVRLADNNIKFFLDILAFYSFTLDKHALPGFFRLTSGNVRKRFLYLAKRIRVNRGRLKASDYPAYRAQTIKPTQVFFNSSVWQPTHSEDLNSQRADIVKILHERTDIQFIGGLRPSPISREHYPDLILEHEPSHAEYMTIVGESGVVINTRGVGHCFAWKLPEYLAAGGCILSAKQHNQLPEPLREGEEVLWYEDDLSDFSDKLDMLLNDAKLCEHLRQGAARYYDRWVDPEQAIKRILLDAVPL